jgi:hypothetical protein
LRGVCSPTRPRLLHFSAALAAIAVAALLSGCAETAVEAVAKKEPFTLEKIEGSEISRITLEPQAATSIGLKTAKVRALGGTAKGSRRTIVPYGAVIYDANGETFVFTNQRPLVFVRQSIEIDRIEGDVVVLRRGPPVGTSVVTDGAAQLMGMEFGVGK